MYIDSVSVSPVCLQSYRKSWLQMMELGLSSLLRALNATCVAERSNPPRLYGNWASEFLCLELRSSRLHILIDVQQGNNHDCNFLKPATCNQPTVSPCFCTIMLSQSQKNQQDHIKITDASQFQLMASTKPF